MVRTQIQLTEQQARALRRVAASRGMSMAAVIREVLDRALTTSHDAKVERALAVVGRFSSGATTVSRDHDRELERAFRE
ncbi:MAG TPA: ribbon-helix-helix protein, CopG family [Gaiellaceae bacterium]|nr:ribbon-helix-helix protein, CopG family [Gaiellaceae bacterium]